MIRWNKLEGELQNRKAPGFPRAFDVFRDDQAYCCAVDAISTFTPGPMVELMAMRLI
jgi:hypothetical protein